MSQFVKPKAYLIGYTTADMTGIEAYLIATKQQDFLNAWYDEKAMPLSDGEKLCSFYAKLCYKSLVEGKNANIKAVRDIPDNFRGILNTAHGSVLEHATINFIATDVSRVFTHELVRHRAGLAYSQTSGRYCRLDSIDFVHDPILDDCTDLEQEHLTNTERIVYLMECRKKLRKPNPKYPTAPANAAFWPNDQLLLDFSDGETTVEAIRDGVRWVNDDDLKNFDYKKAVTSAIRRSAPNGQSNEIGFSINFRALRHYCMMRSARGAEWEIRYVTEQVFKLVQSKFPLLFHGAKTALVNNILQISGMKMQPYEIELGHPDALKYWATDDIVKELSTRTTGR